MMTTSFSCLSRQHGDTSKCIFLISKMSISQLLFSKLHAFFLPPTRNCHHTLLGKKSYQKGRPASVQQNFHSSCVCSLPGPLCYDNAETNSGSLQTNSIVSCLSKTFIPGIILFPLLHRQFLSGYEGISINI